MSYFETRYTVEVKSAAVTALDYDFATSAQYTTLLPPQTAPLRVLSGLIVAIHGHQTAFTLGEGVVAYVPHDYEATLDTEKDRAGITKYLYQVPEVYLVKKPIAISHELATSAVAGGVKCLTALHYSLQVLPGEAILICGGGTIGELAAQFALNLGLRVFTTGLKADKDQRFKALQSEDIPRVLLSETGGLGVNHLLDLSESHTPQSKRTMLQCLGIRGKWAICDMAFQLDPPEALQLFFRCGAICFVNEEIWLQTGLEHGKLTQILTIILGKVEQGLIEPKVSEIMSIASLAEARMKARQGVVVIKPL